MIKKIVTLVDNGINIFLLLTYIDNSKPAAAKLASTLMRSALDATATLRPLFLHCSSQAANQKEILNSQKRQLKYFSLAYLYYKLIGTREPYSRIWLRILQVVKYVHRVMHTYFLML